MARSPRNGGEPAFPRLVDRLCEIDRASAEELPLALTDDGCTLRNVERFRESL
ncbi:hypothetical protein AB0N28_04150 [Streptomyces sp. NPDC051130]|uniref:hypothetical protein n=1 Tax=Streptomyces sp. NPDC051130 TaxID=3157223 RepID=UPI0034258A12